MTKKNEDNIPAEYINYYNNHKKIYGEKSFVLMQVGSFYEAYSTDDDGPDLYIIADLLNIAKTRRNPNDKKITHMVGFPTPAIDKFLQILIDDSFTVMIIDQVTPSPNPKRKITGIYSKGNYICNTYSPESNFIASLYFEELPQKNLKPLLCVGMSSIDLSTGEVIVHETISSTVDSKLALDECNRFLLFLNPKEIVLNFNILTHNKKDFIFDYLELEGKFYHDREFNKKFSKISYQTEILNNSYSFEKSFISIIEILDIEKIIFSTISLVILIDFSADHQENIIKNLHIPKKFQNKNLILGNNASIQLNIIKSDTFNSHNKIKCLEDVINKASTPIGKRFIKNKLLSPNIDFNNLKSTYDTVDLFLEDKKFEIFNNILINIKDIERLERKIGLLTIQPYELHCYFLSLIESSKLLKIISKDKKLKYINKNNIHNNIDEIIKKSNDIFDYEKLSIINFSKEFQISFFKKGYDSKIDNLVNSMDLGHTFLEKLCNNLNQFILEKGKFAKFHKENKIISKNNKSEGYYLYTTKIRGEILYNNLQNEIKKGKRIINIDNIEVDYSSLEFKYLKNACKITFPLLKKQSNNINIKIKELNNLLFKKFNEYLSNLYNEYHSNLISINKIIMLIDYYKTISQISFNNHYTKPIIKDKEFSYIVAKELRHPIVEKLIDHEYIPHDINIGNDLKGILIYGLNSSGKSVLMKAVGISVILAQAGFFVPAKYFEFSPYESIYTRITGNDNLFRGLSSYALEMVELNAILKRSNNKTLILGDEVCRGTEHISGNAIVASTILELSKNNSSFIFATHLHEINELDEIKKLDNVKSFYISVDYDSNSDCLIYDRKLKEGTGERIYGITVAKSIIHDKNFIDNAINIKNKLLDTHTGLLGETKSRYNSSKYVYECELCGKKKKSEKNNLETHHINFQQDFNDNGIHNLKNHVLKNSKCNLLILCDKCHDKIHNNNIKIDSIKMTNKGKKIIVKH